MASYQQIETRLRSVERMIEFVMRTFAVTTRYEHPLVPGQMVQESKTLLDVYRQTNHLGLSIEDVTEQPSASGATVEAEVVNV